MRRLFATVLRYAVAAALLPFVSLAGAAAVQPLDHGWEYHQGALGSIWEIWRGDAATDNVKWTPVTLPHCFNARDAVDPDVHYYEGPGWYRTRLKVSNPYPGGRTLLHFEGAGQKSKVFVGLNQVGEHVGGYNEWNMDITGAETNINANGELPVAVLCDNSRDAEMIPSDLSDFCRYGGLYRHVNLVYVPAISLSQIHITPKFAADGTASVQVWAQLYNPTAATGDLQFTVEVRDPQGNLVQTATNSSAPWPGEKEIAAFQIASPKLWSPSSPSLYSCAVALKSASGEQTLENNFGVRSVEWVDHGPFKLNGERLLLRGTQYHEDDAGAGAAVSDAAYRRTFEQIKAMGANFVRLTHYQQSPQVLDLCDRLGLLVWEEAAWCRGGLGGERYQQQCRDMLTDMIGQHYDHPSVILWSLGNEIDWPGDFSTYDTNAIRQFMIRQNTLAHQLDPTRQTALRRCDFCRDIVDVYSPSIWAGWYSGRYSEYRKAVDKAIADNNHFFHAEWGADSVAGRHSEDPEKFMAVVATGQGTAETGSAYKSNGGKARASRDGDWSESYAINLFDWTLHEQETMSNLTGSAMWVFRDFPTPLRPDNPVPLLNQKGIVQRDGTPKESYYVFQSYWSDQPMIHIYGHTWPVRWGKAGDPREVKVFSNCREVELFVNGVSAGARQRNSADFPAAGLRWNVHFSEGTNTLRAVGRSDGAAVADEISQVYQTAAWDKPAKLTLNEIARTNDVATIEARVFDKDGVPCLDAANVIRFGLAGDGRLLDDLGTGTGSRVVQLCNGHAQIGLQLTGRTAMTSVSSAGLNTVFLKVESRN
jgi:beta-galactosidase